MHDWMATRLKEKQVENEFRGWGDGLLVWVAVAITGPLIAVLIVLAFGGRTAALHAFDYLPFGESRAATLSLFSATAVAGFVADRRGGAWPFVAMATIGALLVVSGVNEFVAVAAFITILFALFLLPKRNLVLSSVLLILGASILASFTTSTMPVSEFVSKATGPIAMSTGALAGVSLRRRAFLRTIIFTLVVFLHLFVLDVFRWIAEFVSDAGR